MNAEEYCTQHWIRNQIWTHLGWPRHQERFDQIAKRCQGKGERFLDVGCACGHSTQELARRVPGRWLGCDSSLTAISMARQEFPEHEFHLYEGGPFPIADVIVCSEVLEHVPDDAEFALRLFAAARVRVVVTTPAIAVNDPGHLRLYTEAALWKLFPLASAGELARFGNFWLLTVDK